MESMFTSASNFDQPLPWDVSNVLSFREMFSDSKFNQDISSWDVSAALDFEGMFEFPRTEFRQNLCAWGPKMNKNANTNRMFLGTDCPAGDIPVNLSAVPPGPLCFECV